MEAYGYTLASKPYAESQGAIQVSIFNEIFFF